MPSIGTVYLVGAGPGDPELVTVKASRLIRECDALVYDYLVAPEMLEWVRADCRRICVGKRSGFHSLPQEEIQELLLQLAREGLKVVRLKGGDPFIFGRGGEEAQALRSAAIPYEVVPAVTAALGCAAYAGVPLTHRASSAAVTFISGHEAPEKQEADQVDWAAHARSGATLVLYMAMGRLEEISGALIAGGRAGSEPVMVVEWGTTPRQRTLSSSLESVAGAVAEAGLGAPAVVIIGPVAACGNDLSWFRPLG